MKHALGTVLATVCTLFVLLVPAASPAVAAQAAFSVPLQLPGSFGFGEPSMAIGSGKIVITAPNGLLTTATADQPSPVWISSDGGTSFNGPIFPADATFELGRKQ